MIYSYYWSIFVVFWIICCWIFFFLIYMMRNIIVLVLSRNIVIFILMYIYVILFIDVLGWFLCLWYIGIGIGIRIVLFCMLVYGVMNVIVVLGIKRGFLNWLVWGFILLNFSGFWLKLSIVWWLDFFGWINFFIFRVCFFENFWICLFV